MSEIVCSCFQVTKDQVIKAIKDGHHTSEALGRAVGVTRGCGGCHWDVENMVDLYADRSKPAAPELPSPWAMAIPLPGRKMKGQDPPLPLDP